MGSFVFRLWCAGRATPASVTGRKTRVGKSPGTSSICNIAFSGANLLLWNLWTFWDYVTEDNHNLIAEWYLQQDPGVQAEFDVTIGILRATDEWDRPDVREFKVLTGRNVGLGEIRFHVLATAPGSKNPFRRRFRPVGIWPVTTPYEFTLILGCEKRRATYTPHAAFDLALKHKANLEQGRGTTIEHR
jgi:hypothetical protein